MALTVEELAGVTVRFIESLARKVERLSTGLVVFVAVPSVVTIVLSAAFIRGTGLVLIVLFVLIVGGLGLTAALVARWRFRAVTQRAPRLASELHQLLVSDPRARDAIDTYVVDDDRNGERFVADIGTPVRATPRQAGMMGSARSLLTVRRFVGDNMDRFTTITAAVSAAKVGPWLVLAATAAAVYLSMVATMLALASVLNLIFS